MELKSMAKARAKRRKTTEAERKGRPDDEEISSVTTEVERPKGPNDEGISLKTTEADCSAFPAVSSDWFSPLVPVWIFLMPVACALISKAEAKHPLQDGSRAKRSVAGWDDSHLPPDGEDAVGTGAAARRGHVSDAPLT